MSFRVVDNVGYRTNEAAKPPNPIDYESKVYQKGLQYERPPFTFQTQKWEEQAMERMSAESKVSDENVKGSVKVRGLQLCRVM